MMKSYFITNLLRFSLFDPQQYMTNFLDDLSRLDAENDGAVDDDFFERARLHFGDEVEFIGLAKLFKALRKSDGSNIELILSKPTRTAKEQLEEEFPKAKITFYQE